MYEYIIQKHQKHVCVSSFFSTCYNYSGFLLTTILDSFLQSLEDKKKSVNRLHFPVFSQKNKLRLIFYIFFLNKIATNFSTAKMTLPFYDNKFKMKKKLTEINIVIRKVVMGIDIPVVFPFSI